METDAQLPDIKLEKLDFSLLVVEPRKAYLTWLGAFLLKKYSIPVDRAYITRENSVWIIPSYRRFTQDCSLNEFLEKMKPKILLSELFRFGATAEDFESSITAETFDRYFDLMLRNEAALITELINEMNSTRQQ